METGFSLYGTAHICWLILLAVLTGAICYAFKKTLAKAGAEEQGSRARKTWLAAAGGITLILHLAQLVWWQLDGSLNRYTLPVHVCALAVYLLVLFLILRGCGCRARFPEAALFFPCLPGAVAAILFPDWTDYPPFGTLSCLGFLGHGAIVVAILLAIKAGFIRPSWRLAPYSVLFLALYAAIMIPVDRAYGLNYGFLIEPVPGSPLAWIEEVCEPGIPYQIGYAAFALFILLIWFALWVPREKKCDKIERIKGDENE